MAIALIQTVATSSGAGTSAAVTISPSTANSLLVAMVAVTFSSASFPLTSVMDDAGNSYTQVPGAAVNNSSTKASDIWYSAGSIAGATTVTFNFSTSFGSFSYLVTVMEFSGAATISPVDTANSLAGSAPPVIGPSLTNSNTGSVLISTCTYASVNDVTVDSPWTGYNFGGVGDAAGFYLPGTTGTFQMPCTGGGTGPFAASGVAFLPAPPPPLTLSLSDTQSSSDLKINEVEKPLTDTQSSSDMIAFAKGLNLSDSTTLSDTGPQAFSIESSFIAPNPTPVFETLTNELIPAFVKTYYQIIE